jgi:Tol biopolymer transport system component
VTFTVNAVPTAMLTVAAAGTGTGSVATQGGLSPAIACTITNGAAGTSGCSATYPAGTHVTLSASAAVANTFGGWSGACSGTGSCSITTTSSAQQVVATFSPTPLGSHPIVFESTRGGSNDIWKINPDGSGLTQLTTNHSNSLPAWSHDGTKIAYTHYGAGGAIDVIAANADGSNPMNLTSGAADGGYPRWSPDGTHLASGASQIYVMKSDGTGLANITNDASVVDAWPMWCSNTRIVFGSSPITSTSFSVMIMNRDGSGRTTLAVSGAKPECSPDGTKILYSGSDGIRIMNIDGTGSHLVIPPRGARASWSPDGQRLVVDGFGGLHIFAVDGSGGTLVAPENGASDQYPNWSP